MAEAAFYDAHAAKGETARVRASANWMPSKPLTPPIGRTYAGFRQS